MHVPGLNNVLSLVGDLMPQEIMPCKEGRASFSIGSAATKRAFYSEDSGKRSFHPASNYDGITERSVMIDVDGEMIEVR